MKQHRSSKPKRRRDESTPIIRQRAKELRQEMTLAERRLWDRIRRKQLAGLKFRRQHPIGPYIVDFYCAAHDLVIEIDGSVHNNQDAEDAQRTQELERLGYRVIRFANEQVLNQTNGVCAAIAAECDKLPEE